MIWPWQQQNVSTLPRLHHWLIAMVMLMGMMIGIPIFAALT